MPYKIVINLCPEEINKSKYYFWCVRKITKDCNSNCGHGWSSDVINAAMQAYKYYARYVKDQPSLDDNASNISES